MMHIRLKKLRRIMAIVLIDIVLVVCMLFTAAFIHIHAVQNNDVENPMFTDGDLKIIMIDVGQGDSFLFLQKDKAMLVDAGPQYRMNDCQNALKQYGVRKLDYIILTHYHQDHAAGLYSVLANTRVEKILVTDMSTNSQTIEDDTFYKIFYKYMNTVDLLTSRDLVKLAKVDGEFEDFYFSDSYVHFLAPVDDKYDIVNNYSLCFKMTYGDVDIMMTGDIQSEVEEQILESGENISCEIYKAAHHGSKTSNTKEFVSRVNPQFVLISSANGERNNFGHPVKQFVDSLEERGVTVFRTDEMGTIEMYTDGQKIYYYPNKIGDYKSGKEIIQ
jgi:competence protein ComEC